MVLMKSNISIFSLLAFEGSFSQVKKLFDSFFFFLSDYLNMSFHCLLAFMIILLNVMSFFFIAVFKILSLSLAFISLIMIDLNFDICKSIHVAFTELLGCVD